MSWFTGLITMFKGLSWFQAAAGIAGLGFLGPVPAILAGIVQLVWKGAMFMLNGVGDIVAQPARAITATVLCMVTLLVGLHYGKAWDAHLVIAADARTSAAKQETANLESQLASMKAADDARAKEAREARDAAKKSAPVTTGSIDKSKRMRSGAGSQKDSCTIKVGVLCF